MKMHDAVRLLLTTQLSDRDIAEATGIAKSTANRYRTIVREKSLSWQQLANLGPRGVRSLMLRPRSGGKRIRLPDLAALDAELRGKSMALKDWWQDYSLQRGKGGGSYSHLAARLQQFRASQQCVMRQEHKPGERAFVDYSGDKPFYIDPKKQQRVHVELFVGVLPASSLTFAMCTATQKSADFIRAHVAMFEFFGGSPQVLVPDNLKAGVTTPGRLAVVQRSYEEMARHYGATVLPARPYKPRDKATVEQSVKLVQQRILSRLRHQHFYSLGEINAEVARLMEISNNQLMQRYRISRRVRFEAMERHALTPLPAAPFVYAEWISIPRVGKDYHVYVQSHAYSVPHRLIGHKLDARVTDTAVEILQDDQCVAKHARSTVLGGHTTHPSHQPKAHRWVAERNPEAFLEWAKGAGPYLFQFVQQHLGGRTPHAGLPACEVLRGLAERHGAMVTNEAVRRAIRIGYPNITTVKRLLASPPKPIPRSSAQREMASC